MRDALGYWIDEKELEGKTIEVYLTNEDFCWGEGVSQLQMRVGVRVIIFLYLHENMLWVLTRSS